MKVGNLEGVFLGTVSHFVDSAAGSLMVITGAAEEYWVPARPQHLKKVDLEARTIEVDWPAQAK